MTVVNSISKDAPMSFVGEAVGCAVAIVLTIVLIQVVGFADPKEKEEPDTEKGSTNEESCGEEIVDSPMRGKIIPLCEVLVKICTALQCDIGDIMELTPEKSI